MNNLKICGAPIDVNPSLFTWSVFQRYAHLIDKKPHYEVFKSIESLSDKTEMRRFLACVWDYVLLHPPKPDLIQTNWIVSLKYFSWVCCFEEEVGYTRAIWQGIELPPTLNIKGYLVACQQAEKKFYDNMIGNGNQNLTLRAILDEMMLPCIEVSRDIMRYLDANTSEAKEQEQS